MEGGKLSVSLYKNGEEEEVIFPFFFLNLKDNDGMTKMPISLNLNFLFTLLHSFQHPYKTIYALKPH